MLELTRWFSLTKPSPPSSFPRSSSSLSSSPLRVSDKHTTVYFHFPFFHGVFILDSYFNFPFCNKVFSCNLRRRMEKPASPLLTGVLSLYAMLVVITYFYQVV